MAMNGFRGKSGNDAPFVRALQQMLAAKGLYKGRIDGDAGEMTRDALRQLQRSRGLPETGTATADTMAALRAPMNPPMPNLRPTPPVDPSMEMAHGGPPEMAAQVPPAMPPDQSMPPAQQASMAPAPVDTMPMPNVEPQGIDPARDTSEVDGAWTMPSQMTRQQMQDRLAKAVADSDSRAADMQGQSDQYWSGDISQPPPYAGKPPEPMDVSTANSPLAGVQSYQPDLAGAIANRGGPTDQQKMAATAELVRQLQMRQQQNRVSDGFQGY